MRAAAGRRSSHSRSPSPRPRPRRRHARAPARTARFFSARHGVGVEAPPGWTLSQHTGYPTVLVALVHPGGSRISLAVDQTTVKDAAALVEQSKPGLVAQGLTIERVSPGPHDGVQVDARAARRNQALRQLYIVRSVAGGPDGKQAVVVTLAAPAADLAAASGPFDWVLAHLSSRRRFGPTPSRTRAVAARATRALDQLVALAGDERQRQLAAEQPAERRDGVALDRLARAVARTARPCTSTSSSTSAPGPCRRSRAADRPTRNRSERACDRRGSRRRSAAS